MLLAQDRSSPLPSVFSPTQELVARLHVMNHGVLSTFTPGLLASSQMGAFLPCSHTRTLTKERKNAQSSMKSALWPPRDPSPSLLSPLPPAQAGDGSSPLLLPAPSSPLQEHRARRSRAHKQFEVPRVFIQPVCLEAGRCLSPWETQQCGAGRAALAAAGFPDAVTSRAEQSLRFPWVTVGCIYSLLCYK